MACLRACGPRFAPTTYHTWGPASLTRQHYGNDLYAPFFSLLDDLTTGSEVVSRRRHGHGRQRWSAPRFDVKEDKDSYSLEGEVPGVEQKDLSIEFTDEHTLVISGRSESSRQEGTQPTAEVTAEGASTAETPAQEATKDTEDAASSAPSSHQPTVEDANEDGTVATKPAEPAAEVAEKPAAAAPKPTYWVSERSSGSFTRSFSFPQRVDQDAVKASLKNGVLSITVPKAAAPESRRIAIE